MISAPSGLVSVIVPVYNGEKHLRGCVESILNQLMEILSSSSSMTDRQTEATSYATRLLDRTVESGQFILRIKVSLAREMPD